MPRFENYPKDADYFWDHDNVLGSRRFTYELCLNSGEDRTGNRPAHLAYEIVFALNLVTELENRLGLQLLHGVNTKVDPVKLAAAVAESFMAGVKLTGMLQDFDFQKLDLRKPNEEITKADQNDDFV